MTDERYDEPHIEMARLLVARDPVIVERTREIHEAIARGDAVKPGLTVETLPAFLEQHRPTEETP